MFLIVFFCVSSPCYPEGLKRSDTIAAELSRSIAFYHESSSLSNDRADMVGRDPLQPLMDAQGNVLNPTYVNSELMVQGIVNSGKSQVALINNKLYSQGDTIGHNRILEIHADGIMIQDEKGTTFVPLYPDSSKE